LGSILGATRFPEKKWVWNRVHSALWVEAWLLIAEAMDQRMAVLVGFIVEEIAIIRLCY
jgi:hypothetical protein